MWPFWDRKGLWNRLHVMTVFNYLQIMTGLMPFKCPEAVKDQFKRKWMVLPLLVARNILHIVTDPAHTTPRKKFIQRNTLMVLFMFISDSFFIRTPFKSNGNPLRCWCFSPCITFQFVNGIALNCLRTK